MYQNTVEIEDVSRSHMSVYSLSTDLKPILDSMCDQIVESEETQEQSCFPSYGFSDYLKLGNSEELNKISDSFSIAAAHIGKTIISEEHLSNKDKQIPPLNNSQGVAGGVKFIAHNIFFKYPSDKCNNGVWLYGGLESSHEFSSNAANHDLKGLTHFMMADKDNLFDVPLIATIDYQGYRLTAMEKLAISDDTLKCGSANAGKTIVTDPELHKKLMSIAKELNLQPHLVSDTEVALCGDLEIHKIGNKYYVLDLARIFPPMFPSSEDPIQSVFFRMFRPEFVKQYKTPLVSDALTGWLNSDPNMNIYNKEVSIATKELFNKIIPNFANYLCKNIDLINHKFITTSQDSINQADLTSPMTVTEPLVIALHEKGINIRHLGHVRYHVHLNEKKNKGNPAMKAFLLDLMLVRVLKNYWRAEIRKNFEKARMANDPSASIHMSSRVVSIYILNILLDDSKYVSEFWEEIIKKINLCFGKHFELTTMDINEFIPKIKYPPLLDYHSGLYHLMQASESKTVIGKMGFLKHAKIRLARSYASSPTNIEFSYKYALSLFESYTLGSSEKCDLQFITQQFEIYLEHLKNENKEKEYNEEILRLIAVVMYQVDDELIHDYPLKLLIRKFAPDHESLITKETVYKIWNEFPDVLKNFLSKMKDYIKMFLDMVQIGTFKGDWYVTCAKNIFIVEPQSKEILYALFYLHYEDHSENYIKLRGWSKNCKEETYSLWYYIQRLLIMDGSNFIDKYITFCEDLLKNMKSFENTASYCETLFYTILSNPTHIKVYEKKKDLEALFRLYVHRIVRQLKILPETVDKSWLKDITYLLQLLLYSFPEMYSHVLKLQNAISEVSKDYGIAIMKVITDISLNIEGVDIRSLYKNYDAMLKFLSINDQTILFSRIDAPRFLDNEKKFIMITAPLSKWISIIFQKTTLLDIADIETNKKDLLDIVKAIGEIRQKRQPFIQEKKKSSLLSNFINLINDASKHELQAKKYLQNRDKKVDMDSILKLVITLGDLKQLEEYVQQYPLSDAQLADLICYSITTCAPENILLFLLQSSLSESSVSKVWETVFALKNSEVANYLMDQEIFAKHILQLSGEHPILDDGGFMKCFIGSINHLTSDLNWIKNRVPQLSWSSQIEVYTSLKDLDLIVQLNHQHLLHYVEANFDQICDVCKDMGTHFYQCTPCDFAICSDCSRSSLLSKIITDKKYGVLFELIQGGTIYKYSKYISVVVHGKSLAGPPAVCAICVDMQWLNVFRDHPLLYSYAADVDGISYTALHFLAKCGNETSVEYLLDKGWPVDIPCGNEIETTPLQLAVREGQVDVAKLLLSKGAKIDVLDYEDRTLLHLAANGNHTSLVAILLEKKLDVNARDAYLYTPLMLGANEPTGELVRLLLENKADVNAVSHSGQTALNLAASNCALTNIQHLLNAGASFNPSKTDHNKQSILHHALGEHNSKDRLEVVTILLEKGFPVGNADKDYEELLNFAKEGGTPEICQHIIDVGNMEEEIEVLTPRLRESDRRKFDNNPTAYDKINLSIKKHINPRILTDFFNKNKISSPSQLKLLLASAVKYGNIDVICYLTSNHGNKLMEDQQLPYLACENGSIETVQYLLDQNVSFHVTSKSGESPLHVAISNRHHNLVSFLLNLNCNPNTMVIETGDTPLHTAVINNSIQILSLLINAKSNVNAKNLELVTPLHQAVLPGIVKLLLAAGARVDQVDQSGNTPLHNVVLLGQPEITSLLINAEADINAKNLDQKTPLHIPCKLGHLHIVKLLVESSCDLEAKDYEGNTPLCVAVTENHLDIVRFLIKSKCNLNTTNSVGDTLLHSQIVSVNNDHTKILQVLINSNCDLNKQNDDGFTPLHLASQFSCKNTIKLLLDAKCNPDILNAEGNTALQMAIMEDKQEIISLLSPDSESMYDLTHKESFPERFYSYEDLKTKPPFLMEKDPQKLEIYLAPSVFYQLFENKLSDSFAVLSMDVIEIYNQPSKDTPLYKVIVIGEYAVGKTSIIKRYCEGYFTPNYKLTIGVDFAVKEYVSEQTRMSLQLWDVAGHERYGTMTRVYYKYAVAGIVVFDLSRPSTFDAVIKWRDDINNKVILTDNTPIPLILLANKCDLLGVSIDTAALDEFCKNNHFKGWFKTSAQENTGIDEAMDFLVGEIIEVTKNIKPSLPSGNIILTTEELRRSKEKGDFVDDLVKNCCN